MLKTKKLDVSHLTRERLKMKLSHSFLKRICPHQSIGAALAMAALLVASNANATALLVNQVNPYIGYGVGLSSWTQFTGDLNTAFGAGNVTISGSTLDTIGNLNSYDALILTARQPGQDLGAAEIAPLQAFIASGKRVLLIGENSNWAAWNNSILGVVGGSYSGSDTSSILSSVVADAITAGVASLNTSGDGIASGGTSLFSQNVVTLWSPDVLSILSVNIVQDSLNNPVFDNNVAQFLASGSGNGGNVPEPGSLALLGLGLVGLAALRRSK